MSTNSVPSRSHTVHFPPTRIDRWLFSFLQLIPDFFTRIICENVFYHIETEITSPATRVIFTRSKRTHGRICLKVWLRWNDELYDTRDITTCAEYMVDGLRFNRRFAQHIYLGIAPVELGDQAMVRRGKLIAAPNKSQLAQGVEYALVMKYLNNDRQLNALFQAGKLNKEADMVFLGKEVARMHQQLEQSPVTMGQYACLAEKLALNLRLLREALRRLEFQNALAPEAVAEYLSVGEIMTSACQARREQFAQRAHNGHIRRCHGDLKASNLWVIPFVSLRQPHKALVALDCVDFNHPEFCHIDTLSDVAMLAIDIETRLSITLGIHNADPACQRLVQRFLATYLAKTQENSPDAWSLLTYYRAEKAMVCAYMSILYDQAPDLGKHYLEVMLAHAREL